MVLAQAAIDAKSNEITAVPALLNMLKLKGTIVTTDALHCQRGIAQQIVDQGGDYCLALKGNQGTLHHDVARHVDDLDSETTTMEPVVDGDHGRIETRTAAVVTRSDGWPTTAGPASQPSVRWSAAARSATRIPPRQPTTCSGVPCRPSASTRSHASTGASKTASTGGSTSS